MLFLMILSLFVAVISFAMIKNSSLAISKTINPAFTMDLTKKEIVVALINSYDTGDKSVSAYINPDKYIQHNLSVEDGIEGYHAILEHAPKSGFKAKVLRAFQDGDYVFSHSEYNLFGPKVAFDIFRFEHGKIVEHWSNMALITPPNPSGRTQLDGAMNIEDKEKTDANIAVVKNLMNDVFLNGQNEKIPTYINPEKYIQHNSDVADGLDGLGAALEYFAKNDMVMTYTKLHKVLGEGNFVLSTAEGKFGKAPGDHVAYYDLFRLENGQIVEHWDVIQPIPPKSEWKNNNGKF